MASLKKLAEQISRLEAPGEPNHPQDDVDRESDRQAILLSLALCSLQRPGWENYMRSIARTLHGETMFDEFRKYNADDVLPAGLLNRVRQRIAELEIGAEHALTGSLASVQVNAPRALMQCALEAELTGLYWVLGKRYISKLKGTDI